jgi:hypothetical protein
MSSALGRVCISPRKTVSSSPGCASQDQQELERAVLELCRMRCPKCGRKLEEILYQNVRIDRCTGCGGVWLDPGELDTLAPEAHTSWLGELLSRMTGRGEDSR